MCLSALCLGARHQAHADAVTQAASSRAVPAPQGLGVGGGTLAPSGNPPEGALESLFASLPKDTPPPRSPAPCGHTTLSPLSPQPLVTPSPIQISNPMEGTGLHALGSGGDGAAWKPARKYDSEESRNARNGRRRRTGDPPRGEEQKGLALPAGLGKADLIWVPGSTHEEFLVPQSCV